MDLDPYQKARHPYVASLPKRAMTPITQMTNDELRVAMAEALGFHCCAEYRVGRSGNQRIIVKGIAPKTSMQVELPNWPADLNAVAEIEAGLTEDESYEYAETLFNITPGSWTWRKSLYHATAAQRCRALLPILRRRRECAVVAS